jgi:hypothetical protein
VIVELRTTISSLNFLTIFLKSSFSATFSLYTGLGTKSKFILGIFGNNSLTSTSTAFINSSVSYLSFVKPLNTNDDATFESSTTLTPY